MTLPRAWLALQREAQLAAEQIASGVTVLGRANHAQTGLYSQAFFGLSIGLERLGKLIIVCDHSINHSGDFPTNRYLRDISHNLSALLPVCESIGAKLGRKGAYAARPADRIHQGIERTLAEFAKGLRYYNLDFITGTAGDQLDPISMWWKDVGMPICERHYSARQREKDAAKAEFLNALLKEVVIVRHHAEDGSEISDFRSFAGRAGATAVVQKYGRLYVLQIARWLGSILSHLSHLGAYEMRLEPLLGLNEPFILFFNEDKYLRDRKTWSIYRP